MALSKTQIDKLGDRLRAGDPTELDLRELDEYRRSFTAAYEQVVQTIRSHLAVRPTGRPSKSRPSIVAKLRRERIRLSQIQDIAGCRLVVPDTLVQDRILADLKSIFPNASTVDRRKEPTYGYRAVHLIVAVAERRVEIQIRTALQQRWAELSEKFFDVVDEGLKYGAGDPVFRRVLEAMSARVAGVEDLDGVLLEAADEQEHQLLEKHLDAVRRAAVADIDEILAKLDALQRHREAE